METDLVCKPGVLKVIIMNRIGKDYPTYSE